MAKSFTDILNQTLAQLGINNKDTNGGIWRRQFFGDPMKKLEEQDLSKAKGYVNLSTKHFYEYFIEELKPGFLHYGFEYNKPAQSFVRHYEQGRQYLNIEKLSAGIEVRLQVEILNSIIKEIIQLVFGHKQSTHLTTIWWDANHYFNDYDKSRFLITERAEVESGKKNVIDLFENYALPIFEKYKDIRGLDSIVNHDSAYLFHPKCNQSTYSYLVVYTGLITAKLLNHPDYKEIETRNLSHLSRFEMEEKDANMARFNAIDFDKYRKKAGL